MDTANNRLGQSMVEQLIQKNKLSDKELLRMTDFFKKPLCYLKQL